MTETRKLGAAQSRVIQQVNDVINTDKVIKLSAEQVKAFGKGMDLQVHQFLDDYAKATKPEKKQMLANQKLGATIDGFVAAVDHGQITLPANTKALDVVSPAVERFLQAGFTYSITVEDIIGGAEYIARLNDSNRIEWDELIAK